MVPLVTPGMRPTYDALSPADLLYLAHHHDQSAWNELVRRYTPLVWRVARSLRLDPDRKSTRLNSSHER